MLAVTPKGLFLLIGTAAAAIFVVAFGVAVVGTGLKCGLANFLPGGSVCILAEEKSECPV